MKRKRKTAIENRFISWVRHVLEDPEAYGRLHSLIDEHANSVRWMCQTRNAVDDLMLECRRQGFGAGFKAAMELLADISEEDRREKSEDGGETV